MVSNLSGLILSHIFLFRKKKKLKKDKEKKPKVVSKPDVNRNNEIKLNIEPAHPPAQAVQPRRENRTPQVSMPQPPAFAPQKLPDQSRRPNEDQLMRKVKLQQIELRLEIEK